MRLRTVTRVLVAGGGVAGLEALLALRDFADEHASLTLLSPSDEFVYRPLAVAAPSGRGHAARYPLAETADTAGAHARPALHGAVSGTPEAEADADVFGGLLRDIEEGYSTRIAFVAPPGVTWTLPIYELALMTAWQAWSMGPDDIDITIDTPKLSPLERFGPDASAAIRRALQEAGVRTRTGVCVAEDALAAGDVTAVAIKQGAWAAQQADAAAESIAPAGRASFRPRHAVGRQPCRQSVSLREGSLR